MKSRYEMKKYMLSILGLLGMFIFVKNVLAYDLTLTGVGTQSTLGTDYSLVNYIGGIPTLVGTASPSAEVGVKIKTLLKYTTASTSGVWEFVPTALDQGDNAIVISSGVQSIAFVLRFNSTSSATVATPTATPSTALPDAGVWGYYIPALSLGLGVYFIGRYGRKWMKNWDRDD